QRYKSLGAPLHDPCTIVYLVDPSIFSGKECNLQVEISSDLTMGQTVVDWWQATDRPKNAFVVVDGDDERFFSLLTNRVKSLADSFC
ncbi:MAG: nucleoside hydrolase, partial [Alphaproteobacteria bacterium]